MINNSQSTLDSEQKDQTLRVYFKIPYHTDQGKALYIVGNISQLGNWDPQRGLRMQWNENDEWSICLKVDRLIQQIQYKFVVNDFHNPSYQNACWEPGENRVVTQHVLQRSNRNEYFNSEYWGYRTIKLKLNYNLPHKQRMMIIGSIPELGSWKLPVVMKNQQKIDIISNEPIQQWSISLVVNPTNFSFRYYYVIRNDDTGTMIWERGNGRSLKSEDLHSFRLVEEEFAESPIRVKTQLYFACQIHQINRNGSFCPSMKNHRRIQNVLKGYHFFEKGPSFFYYETFGRLNKLDWNFVDQFTTAEINDNILIGPYPQNEQDIINLKSRGVRAVLNLQTRLDMYHRGVNWDELIQIYKKQDIVIKNFEIYDMDPNDFEKKANKGVSLLKKLINKYELVYVHCTSGIGRAPSLVVLYLSTVLKFDLNEAIKLVKLKRQQFYINYDMLRTSLKKTIMYNNGEGYDELFLIKNLNGQQLLQS